jgi:hypothetical protein
MDSLEEEVSYVAHQAWRSSVKVGDRVWSWMNEHMYITVFVLAFVTDFWANWYSYAIVHDWIVLQAFLGMALPFLNLPGVLFFIDQKDMRIRLKLCAVTAIAMSLGSTLMLLMVRAGIGVGKDMIP